MTTTETNTPVVAIGDVHGCATLLREAIWPHLGSAAELILLGDLIDRSPEPNGDLEVIELVRELQDNAAAYGLAGVTVLRGNHEQMLLDALAEDIPGEATDLWEWNGGDLALLPVAREHREWLETLPLTAIRGPYLLVHAGVRPNVPLEQQKSDDFLWIRQPFLTHRHGLPFTVVHGHSITRDHQIDHRSDRINLDSGAFCTGVLSSLRLDSIKESQYTRLPGVGEKNKVQDSFPTVYK
jgi:serine/threonine protein phosphatase 1